MKVHIGSFNTSKIEATKVAFNAVFSTINIEFQTFQVPSQVSAQPLSDAETIQGAINRAQACLNLADYAIGIEGGISQHQNHWFSCGWVAVISQDQIISLASSSRIQLPTQTINQIRKGKELAEIDKSIFSLKKGNEDQGNYGLMTNGLITRQVAYQQAIMCALSRFVHADLF